MLKHFSHRYNLIDDVSEREKTDLLSSMADTDSAKAELEEAIAQVEKNVQSIQTKQKVVDESITNAFKKFYEALQKREKQLLAKSSEIEISKVTALRIQAELLTEVREEIDNTCQNIASAVQVYTPAELLSVKHTMKRKLQSLLQKVKDSTLQPCRNTMMSPLVDTASLDSAIGSFGDVCGGSLPSEGTASINIPRAIIGKERKIIVTARDSVGKQYPYGGDNVSAKLTLMGSENTAIDCTVTDNENGTYKISLIPEVVGQHELSVTIEGQLISRSPSVIHVREARTYTSSQPSVSFSLSSYPYDVAVDDNMDVYVAVHGSHCISVFNKNGSNIRTIGTAGTAGNGDGQFNSPSAIAISGDVMYVVDENNHRIQKLDLTGKFISKFGSSGSGNGQLDCPRGICLDQEGKIYVADQKNNRVCVFTADGTFAYNIVGSCSDGNLSAPWGLAIDCSGNLHVVSADENHVKIFTTEGEYISTYGNTQLHTPAGIAIDEEGSCFIGEWYHYDSIYSYSPSRLVIFNSQYQYVRSITNFKNVAGITLDRDGDIYVADYSNCNIKKYV